MHYSLEAEAELISADERRDYSALNAVRLLCSDDSEAISAEGLRGKWTEYMKCQGKIMNIVATHKYNLCCSIHLLTLF